MIFKKNDITQLERIDRLKLINSLCGVRSVHLIGTKSVNNISNLAIFSSATHFGSDPSILGLVSRPSDIVKRDTISNINSSGYYTINSVHASMIDRAHQTSAKYKSNTSEFTLCGFKEEYIDDFFAPFVTESNIQVGMKLLESIPIKHNSTVLIIGEIQIIKYEKNNYYDNFDDCVGVLGLNDYYLFHKYKHLDYVRINKKL